MDGQRMAGQMDIQTNGGAGGWMYRWMDGQRMARQMDRQMDKWVDG